MIEQTAEGYETMCDMCEHKLKGETQQEVEDLMEYLGWKQEFDTGIWVNLCPDCWEF